jgi:hypothetical protein
MVQLFSCPNGGSIRNFNWFRADRDEAGSVIRRPARPIKFLLPSGFAAEVAREWSLFLAAFDHKPAISQDFTDLSRARAVAFAVRIWHRSAVAGDNLATFPRMRV